jgi:hypothetical protein
VLEAACWIACSVFASLPVDRPIGNHCPDVGPKPPATRQSWAILAASDAHYRGGSNTEDGGPGPEGSTLGPCVRRRSGRPDVIREAHPEPLPYLVASARPAEEELCFIGVGFVMTAV